MTDTTFHFFQCEKIPGKRLDPSAYLWSNEATVERKMTWEEIKKTYPDEWVAIGNRQGDLSLPYGSILGEILAHEHDEQAFTQLLKCLNTTQPIDIRYTGDLLPDNPVGPILWQTSDTNF